MSQEAVPCGECAVECNTDSGLCVGPCKAGWKGLGCKLDCKPGEDCENPCNCNNPCDCDRQFGKCQTDICMPITKESTTGDKLAPFFIGLSASLIFCGLVVMCCFLWRRKNPGLRGVVLSHPICAKCPAFRDCLQRAGSWLGLPGFKLGARDSLDTFCEEDEKTTATHSQSLRQWRRHQPTVIGVKGESIIRESSTAGYKWKKKWRDRRERSKKKRKLKHAERKLRRETASEGDEGRVDKRGSILLPSITRFMSSSENSPEVSSSQRRSSSLKPSVFIQQIRRGSVQPGTVKNKGDSNTDPEHYARQRPASPRQRQPSPSVSSHSQGSPVEKVGDVKGSSDEEEEEDEENNEQTSETQSRISNLPIEHTEPVYRVLMSRSPPSSQQQPAASSGR